MGPGLRSRASVRLLLVQARPRLSPPLGEHAADRPGVARRRTPPSKLPLKCSPKLMIRSTCQAVAGAEVAHVAGRVLAGVAVDCASAAGSRTVACDLRYATSAVWPKGSASAPLSNLDGYRSRGHQRPEPHCERASSLIILIHLSLAAINTAGAAAHDHRGARAHVDARECSRRREGVLGADCRAKAPVPPAAGRRERAAHRSVSESGTSRRFGCTSLRTTLRRGAGLRAVRSARTVRLSGSPCAAPGRAASV